MLVLTRQMFPTTGHTYEIYEQDMTEMDMYTHLPRWLEYLKKQLGRELKPTDRVFPCISCNSTIDPNQELLYKRFCDFLVDFTKGAGMDNHHFTTHSYRHGTAQWRFTDAPPHMRWPLRIICWWRGWAEGESMSEAQILHPSIVANNLPSSFTNRWTR